MKRSTVLAPVARLTLACIGSLVLAGVAQAGSPAKSVLRADARGAQEFDCLVTADDPAAALPFKHDRRLMLAQKRVAAVIPAPVEPNNAAEQAKAIEPSKSPEPIRIVVRETAAPTARVVVRIPADESSLEPVIISNLPHVTGELPAPATLPDAERTGLANPMWRQTEDDQTALQRRLLKLRSWAAVVVDQQQGRVLYSKNPEAIRSIASITKLMTAMVVLDSGASLDQVLTIELADVDMLKGSSSRLKVGTRLTRREMLQLALMSSENRAAAALARSNPLGREAFVRAMNEKARDLGMTDTRFLDSTGLNPNNQSTAYDLALMVNAGYQYPLIREFTTRSEHSIALPGKRLRQVLAFHNSNGLVSSDHWDIGLSKTGYISEAGRCLVLQANIASKSVIIVLLDSYGRFTRLADADRIKRWLEDMEPVKVSSRRM